MGSSIKSKMLREKKDTLKTLAVITVVAVLDVFGLIGITAGTVVLATGLVLIAGFVLAVERLVVGVTGEKAGVSELGLVTAGTVSVGSSSVCIAPDRL